MRSRALAAAVIAGTLVGLAPPAMGAGSVSSAPTSTLQALVASTQLWVGENDILLDLLDTTGTRLDDPVLTSAMDLVGPDGQARGTYPLERVRLADRGRYLYRGRVDLDAVGPWIATVSAQTGAGARLDGEARFEVLDDAGTPALGRPGVPVQNPRVAMGAPLAAITSDPNPVPQLYWWSVEEALRAQRPILYVIDTARPGVNDACGSAMGEARILRGSFPGLVVIHAEPYVVGDTDAVLTHPEQGAPRIAPWADAWGVAGPPWMFVIAQDGTVRAKFQGVFGTDELLSALRRIVPYAPGGH